MYPAKRFVDSQAWWIASELCRRSTQPLVIRQNDFWLGIRSQPAELLSADVKEILVDLTDFGIHAPNIPSIQWDAVMAAEGPHDIVNRLETALGTHQQTPPTTPRTLTYRLLAHALTAHLTARRQITVAAAIAIVGPSGAPSPWFEKAFMHIYKRYSEPFHADHPAELAWALLAGGRAVALLDEDGWLHDPLGSHRHLTVTYAKEHDLEKV